MISNCWLYAVAQFAARPHGYVLARLTRHSRAQWTAPRWLIVVVSVVFFIPAALWLNAGVWLCSGRWLHVAYGEHQSGQFREFVPMPDAYCDRLFPPPLFRGRVVEFSVCTAPAVDELARVVAMAGRTP